MVIIAVDESSLEIWVETKTNEGKSYYYNAKTRDTTWTKPEGENIKVISHEQVILQNLCNTKFFELNSSCLVI